MKVISSQVSLLLPSDRCVPESTISSDSLFYCSKQAATKTTGKSFVLKEYKSDR